MLFCRVSMRWIFHLLVTAMMQWKHRLLRLHEWRQILHHSTNLGWFCLWSTNRPRSAVITFHTWNNLLFLLCNILFNNLRPFTYFYFLYMDDRRQGVQLNSKICYFCLKCSLPLLPTWNTKESFYCKIKLRKIRF